MLLSLSIIFLAGLILAGVFKKLELPSIIGILLAGIIIGPYALDLIDNQILEMNELFRGLALVIILLRAGLALDFTILKKVGKSTILLSIIPFLCEFIVLTLVSLYVFKFDLINALLFATVIVAVSPAVVVPAMLDLIDRKVERNSKLPEIIMSSSSFEVVIVIILFSIIISLANSTTLSYTILITIITSVFLGVLAGIICAYIFKFVFKLFEVTESVIAISIICLALLFIVVEKEFAGIIGFSGYVAVMTFGITYYNICRDNAEYLSVKYREMWVSAEIMLFILVGATVDLQVVVAEFPKAIVIIGIGLIFRSLGVWISLVNSNFNTKQKIFTIFSFTPKATVQAALAPVALTIGLESGNIILTVAVIAILFTTPMGSILIKKGEKNLLHE